MRKLAQSALLGFVGCLALALTSLAQCPPGQGCVSGDSLQVRLQAMLFALTGVALLTLGWALARHRTLREQWLLFAIWTLPLLCCPPMLSKDALAYADQGWIVLQGYDPYKIGMGMIGGPFATQVDSFWQGTTTVYPPFALTLQSFVVYLTGSDPYWSVVAMRLPALIGVVLIGLSIPEIARRTGCSPKLALWGTLLNPLLVIHLVGGAHNDSLAAGLAGVAVALAFIAHDRKCRWGWLVGAVIVGLAMSIKQTLGLAAIPVALAACYQPGGDPLAVWRARWKSALGRITVAVCITVATFVAVTAATGLGFGWLTGSGQPFSVGTNSPSYLICAGLAYLPGTTLQMLLASLGLSLFLVGVCAMVVVFWRKGITDPVAFIGWGLCVFAVASPSLQPWYLLWGGVFLAATKLTRRQATMTLAVSICGVLTAVMQEYGEIPIAGSTVIGAIAYIPIFKLIYKLLPNLPHRQPELADPQPTAEPELSNGESSRPHSAPASSPSPTTSVLSGDGKLN